ncbi:hypothetical protein C1A40_11990 [Tamlana carrageenivorans]|uniref:Fibronectin type-III domain-containing protein n=2 Tax=Pseudotamlana carrageenivorans TaxID=2069432 RepID=A0A2I7SJR7_9FLAO|nr:hypothetical protein C1A40_11990 [Tamlana carrageenivorans]
MKQFTGKISKSGYIILLWMLCHFQLHAQVFPVQVNPQMIPPYSLKLSEYGTAQSERVIVNMLLTDVADSNRRVTLKIYIENNAGLSIQSTEVVIGAHPIILDGGMPLRLTNLDLQPYFSLQNLSGIAPQQYNKTLPEGLYRFCFEVFDERSGQPLSRKSCATAYLVLNAPPFLNLPNRGEQIPQRDPQNIVFQWTPRHLNATNVQYEFTLAEIWDTGMDPQAAFLASRPLYQTTTYANTLLYGPAETALLPDKNYGWRVRAIVTDGISETAVFKNDGYSEIYYFTYTGACDAPSFLLAEAQNPTTQKILWQGAEHQQYKVQYRKKNYTSPSGGGWEGAVWFENNAYSEQTSIYNLEPGTTYEYRVGGMCKENTGFTYSQVNEFTTMIAASDTPSYTCGITPEIVITNKKPLEALVINDVFTAGDFPVTVKEVSFGNVESSPSGGGAAGGGGFFSGWGYITVPYLENTKIKVNFNRIKINSDYQLTEGVVFTDYDKNWGGVNDVGDEVAVLGSLTDVVKQALTLDIDSDTMKNINKLTDVIINLVKEGNLPKQLATKIEVASNQLEEMKQSYDVAKEEYDKAKTYDEKEAAEEKMENASASFKDAQRNLNIANEEVEKLKKEVRGIIKKAIKELYREGKEKEVLLLSKYTKNYNEVIGEYVNEEDIIFIDFVDIKNTQGATVSNQIKEFYQSEIDLLSTLFSQVLEESENEETIQALIEKSKEIGIDLIKEINEMSAQSDEVIIAHIKEKLIESYKSILINYKI